MSSEIKNTRTNAGDQQLVSADLATAVALTVPQTPEMKAQQQYATYAVIQCEAVAVRYTTSGTAPTTTVGTLMNPGDVLHYDGDFLKLKFIRTAAGSILNVNYFS